MKHRDFSNLVRTDFPDNARALAQRIRAHRAAGFKVIRFRCRGSVGFFCTLPGEFSELVLGGYRTPAR